MFEPTLKVIYFNGASKSCCKYRNEINVSFHKGGRSGKRVFLPQEHLTGVCWHALRCVVKLDLQETELTRVLSSHLLLAKL